MPQHWPSADEPSPPWVAVASVRLFLHSHRRKVSARSPLVPRSSSHNGRRHLSSGPWMKRYQSMSLMCPRTHACTKRIGTTGTFFLIPGCWYWPLTSARMCTSGRARIPSPHDSSCCATNHSGKSQTFTPLRVAASA